MHYRNAAPADIPQLAALRKIQLTDEGVAPTCDIDDALHTFFARAMADGSLVEWLAVDGGQIIATAAIVFYPFPPTYTNPSGIKGYITNMYTADAYRGRGIATTMLQKLTDEARARGVHKLWLGASVMGKPVYLRFGFHETGDWLELTL